MFNEALQRASDVLVNDLLRVKKDEVFVITADMIADRVVVDAISVSATRAGAKLLTAWMNTPDGVSEAADPYLPGEALVGMLSAADVWIELNCRWLLYSNVYYRTMKNNKKLRHMCLTGVDTSSMIGCVGSVDYDAMREFTILLRDKIKASREMRMTSVLGEDVRFQNTPDHPISCKLGVADKPGTHFFVGQIGWLPIPESINGKVVFDGSIAPDIGIIKAPIEMEVKNGRVVEISGGGEAAAYEAWLKGFNHPQMLCVAHTGIGFNPGAAVVGSIIQDQRVMGSTTWGFGSIGAGLLPPDGVKAPSHSDAVSLNTTLEVDGVLWMKDGQFVERDLAPLAKRLKKE
jgi:2,5-dihydroxypyridine 5,6-dioxygenase